MGGVGGRGKRREGERDMGVKVGETREGKSEGGGGGIGGAREERWEG